MFLEIDIDEKQAERDIIKALQEETNSILSRASTHIKLKIRKMIQYRITNSPEYKSLVNHGQLQGELGLPNPKQAMDDILNIWIKSIRITLRPAKTTGNDIKAFLDIDMIDGTFQDVLGSPSASFTTDSGQDIPWLEWLLTAGDAVLVRGYDIVFNSKYSRTGLNIMLKSITANWRMPPEFSGTVNDNFVTRALEGIDDILKDIVSEEITKVL